MEFPHGYFKEVMAIVEAEREALGDEDIDPAFYQSNGLGFNSGKYRAIARVLSPSATSPSLLTQLE
jgi:hypothetical protein